MSDAIWIIIGIFLIFVIYTIYRRFKTMQQYDPEQDSKKLIKLTDNNFKKEISKGVVLVDFWAPWCAPCRMIGPVVSDLADDFDGKAKIGKLNVDENKKIAAEFGIRSIPALILFKEGQPVQKFTGVKPKSTFEKEINAHL
jgi:thioredoxin 1